MERGWKPNVEISPSCPRCGSSNTKFCYYNNYSLTQPRYFCKGCRRYWTKGGSLRNVPVGGGCRKNRRSNGKSLRLSTNDGVVHPGSFGNLNNSKNSYNHGHHEGASQDDSSSSSHIDLALVYANFLNPQPDPKASGFEIPELPCEFDPSLELTTTNISYINSDAGVVLPEEEQDLVGCLREANLCDNDHFMYYSELGSTHKHQDGSPQKFTSVAPTHDDPMGSNSNGLPPLPGEDHPEAASQGILWSDNSLNVMDDDHAFQVPQQSLLGSETQDPDHLIFGNWSSFQFSR